jgi:general secretion pathway protein G
MAEWHYRVTGRTFGPFSDQQLKERAASGEVTEDTEVRKGADGEWMPAWRVKGLFGEGETPAEPSGQSGVVDAGAVAPPIHEQPPSVPEQAAQAEPSLKQGSGFKLGCLVAVVVVVLTVPVGVILLGVAGVYFANLGTSAYADIARTQIQIFDDGLRYYHLHVGSYPSTEQGLLGLIEPPPNLAEPMQWKGPYLQKDIPLDPWDNEYRYELLSPTEYRIWSCGPDMADGTEDDISNLDQLVR